MLLEIKALALTHGALAFTRDKVRKTTDKIILLLCRADYLRMGIRIVSGHGTGMYLEITKGTSGSQFRTKCLVQHKAHEGSMSDGHSELVPGDNGLNSSLGSVEGMAHTFVDVISKGIQRGEVMFAVSAYGPTIKRISKGLEHVFREAEDLMLLSKMFLEYPRLCKVSVTLRTG